MLAPARSGFHIAIGKVGGMKMSTQDVRNSAEYVDFVKEQGNYFEEESFPIEIHLNAESYKSEGLKNFLRSFSTISNTMYYSHFTLTAPIFKFGFQRSTYLQEEAYGTNE
ncbi:hypothetical protein LEP3755_07930 [Leptolyngbya sp. NIES-3755]|nr:hypothetical protein LEP3755_07930 [Leptolyngbya sp. NIES-3755]